MPNQRQQPTPQNDDTNLDFEDAIEQVETIIENIESGAIGLEASLDAYEQGVKLIKRCRTLLRNAEQRVQDLSTALEQNNDTPSPSSQPRPDKQPKPQSQPPQEDAPF